MRVAAMMDETWKIVLWSLAAGAVFAALMALTL